MSCTWVDCTEAGEVEQIGKDGVAWAKLCRAHHDKLEESIQAADPKRMLSYWVKAQGGAKAAAKRHEKDAEVIAKKIGDIVAAADWLGVLRKK